MIAHIKFYDPRKPKRQLSGWQQLPGPSSPDERESWLRDLKLWREKRWSELGGRPAQTAYDLPGLKWTQSAFIQTKILVYDRFFYDVSGQRYTVDRLLDDLDSRYGGVESIVLWSVYPNIGVDPRNQLDYTRDLPGGAEGLREAMERFHTRGVRVLLQFMPWDASAGLIDETLPREIVPLAAEIGADGLFADTLGPTPKVVITRPTRGGTFRIRCALIVTASICSWPLVWIAQA